MSGFSHILGNHRQSGFELATSVYYNSSKQGVIAELGQSNMEGRDGASPLHTIPIGMGYEFDGTNIIHLTNDRGDAVGGSHATYFAERLYSLTRIKPVMVEAAKGGAAITEAADNGNDNWSSTGTLRGLALTKINDALSTIGAAFPVCGLISEGERDAQQIDGSAGAYTKVDAKAGFQDLVDWWFNNYPGRPLLIARTGAASPDTQGWQDVRDLQDEIAAENENVYIAFSDAVNFFDELKMKADNLHYNYLGYEEMGHALADSLNSILYGYIPAIPSITALSVSSSEIRISLDSSVTGADTYPIERSLDGSTGWTIIKSNWDGSSYYTDSGLTADTQYYYRVKAANNINQSSYSSIVSATTDVASGEFFDQALLYNASSSGMSITKTGGTTGLFDAGGFSSQALTGNFEFIFSKTNPYYFVGINSATNDQTTSSIDYCWQLNGLPSAATVKGLGVTTASKDVSAYGWLKIKSSGGVVTWEGSADKSSWTVIATSTTPPSGNYYIHCVGRNVGETFTVDTWANI